MLRSVVILLFALGFLLGVVVGRWSMSIAPAADSATSESFRAALEGHDPLGRPLGMARFLVSLGPEDVEQAVEIMEANRIGIDDYEMRMFLVAWIRVDPRAAVEWARADSGGRPGMGARAAMYAWGYHDPQSAIAFLKESDRYDPDSKNVASVVGGWTKNGDVRGLTDFLMAMPGTRNRGIMTNNMAAIIANESTENAIQWAEAVPADAPNNFKTVAYHRVMSALARRDPARAMQWYEEHRSHEYTEGVLEIVARRLVDHHDPHLFFAWLQGLQTTAGRPDASELQLAAKAGFQLWLKRRPRQATHWLEQLIEIPIFMDEALVRMAKHRMNSADSSDPTEALEWAQRIHDPTLRHETVIRLARGWRRKDQAGMETWLSNSDLPQEIHAQILSEQGSDKAREARKGWEKSADGKIRRRLRP